MLILIKRRRKSYYARMKKIAKVWENIQGDLTQN